MATNFGGPRDPDPYHCNNNPVYSECVADSQIHTVLIQSSVPSDIATNFRWSIADYYANTDLMMVELEPGDTDVDVSVLGFSNSAIGWWAATSCAYSSYPTIYGGSETPRPGTRWCKVQVIQVNLYWKASRFPGQTAQRDIACHELGHTVGLQHSTASSGGSSWSSSCMVLSSTTNTTTTAHDRAHINARY